MTLYDRIINVLKSNKVDYFLYEYDPVRTSIETANIRGTKLSEGAKALIFVADNNFVQVVIEGNKKEDKNKFKSLINIKRFKMVSKEEVKAISGIDVGAVPPFANLFNTPLQVYVNKSLLYNKFMEFNAGD